MNNILSALQQAWTNFNAPRTASQLITAPVIQTPLSNAQPINYRQVGNNIQQFVGNIKNNVGNAFSDLGTNAHILTEKPQTFTQDYPYRFAEIANRGQQNSNNLIHIPYQAQPSAFEQAQEKQYQNASLVGKMQMDNDSLDWTPTSASSADYNHYYFSAPPQDKLGAGYKQEVLNNNNFLPAAQEYLQTIPYSGTRFPNPDNAGQSQSGTNYGQPFIQYDTRFTNDQNFSREIAAHEIMHQAVGVFGKEQLGSFLNDFGKALRQDPQHYQPIAQWLADYRAQREGTGYFNDPLTAANEMFAQIGAVLGPGMVNDPYLGQYYRKVFQANNTPLPPPPQMMGKGVGKYVLKPLQGIPKK